MNSYDFDDTIFTGDSSMAFYLYCLRRHKKMLRRLPKQLAAFIKHYVFHSITKTQMKEVFYTYFEDIPDIEKTVLEFWEKNLCKIKPFYLAQKQEDDVIISASPEFFLLPACQKLGLKHLIASRIDPLSGQCIGENCHGEEKVKRFWALFPDATVEAFYSDSLSDTPMSRIAQKAYLVCGETVKDWPL